MSETIAPLTQQDGESKDLVAKNIEKLKQLFPEIVTDGKVDFETLKEVLGEFREESSERYSFTWNGKSKARKLAMTPSRGTLRPAPEESVNWDTTENLFIEGDNLEVLKLLQRSYHRKVKMIYIDPPYNTGNDFVYPDDYKNGIVNYLKLTGQVDDDGKKISSNPEYSGRFHTDWLNMIYPRLKLARELLKEDGVIFISIDDRELSNLKKICDEIYGEENYIACFIWEKRTNRENRKQISSRHDYILCYSYNATFTENAINMLPMSKEALSRYKNPDNDPRGPWKSDPATAQAGHGTQSQFYVLEAPNGKEHELPSGRCWLYTKKEMKKAIDEDRIWFGRDGNNVPRVKTYLNAKERGLTPESILFAKHASTNESAKNHIKSMFGGKAVFETPKPVELLSLLLEIGSNKNDLILDFFAGSSATAEAVLRSNKKNKFIMVQLPEECEKNSIAYKEGFNNIAEISKERIRRAIKNIKSSDGTNDLGFRVFKLDTSNIKPWDPNFDEVQLSIEDSVENIKKDRTEDDVLYEILLKYGLDLTLPIEEQTIVGTKVYIAGAGALILCLAPNINLDVVEGIAALKEELNPELTRIVFRDSGFKGDVVKTNAVQILKQHGIEDVRSI